MCKGYARLHGRLPEALLRAAPSKKKAVVYQHARLVGAGNVDWWDKMTNNYEGGDPDDGDNVGANDKLRWGPPILLFVLPAWTNGTLPP